ncbi:hypothetical protein GCM10022281_00980 [Sphingomonas rosea]|uniref:Peptidase M56 domain-containing protein n=1 Tax=Sphingomonas rosea TaxID=335605 RepID=A0ABP7TH05_9SPHN
MEQLIAFALKSLLIAGVTLGLLHLLRHRSASERSMVAHFGLLALLLLPIGSMFLPQLVVHQTFTAPAAGTVTAPTIAETAAVMATSPAPLTPAESFALTDLWPLAYGLPVAVLLAITFLAVLRLLTLRARSSVLLEPTWLTALAQAQHRMDFKHGTALLTSKDLKSPISWGVMSPVILLNEEALEAKGEAEAIIAHELAHVRGMDWAKLLLARAVSAIHWFNPLVWILAREAHQLREETADDAVLAADVAGPDYAQLLVGVARHECRGLLIGAHGVAPSKSSLSRRVRRVLDGSLPRTPAARGFAAGIALGVVGTAAPLAALTLSPAQGTAADQRYAVSAPAPQQSLPAVVARSVAGAAAITSQAVAANVSAAITGKAAPSADLERQLKTQIAQELAAAEAPEPPEVAYGGPLPPRAPRTPRSPKQAELDRAVDQAVANRALGVTAQYAAEIRAAVPGVTIADDDMLALKAVGVSPQWLAEMRRAGYSVRDVDDLAGARAVGVSPAYVADLASAGIRNVGLEDLTAMRALGVTGAYVRQLRASGQTNLTPDRIVTLRANGFAAEALRWGHKPPRAPKTPEPPEAPEPDEPDEPGN